MTIHLRAAQPAASTVDIQARTVEAIVSTGAGVLRGSFTERLDLSGVDLSRLIGAPLLDAHRAASTRDQLGVVEAAEVRSEGLWVRLRFRSNDAAKAVLSDIEDGTLRGLSIGYSVAEWKDEGRGASRTRTATKWTPIEVSVVPVPADAGAHFRNGETDMPETQTETAPLTRAAINTQIRSIATTAGLNSAWADAQIDAEADLDAVRQAAFEAMQQRGAEQTPRTTRAAILFDNTDPTVIAARAGEALFARSHPEHQVSDQAREYAHMNFTDLARDCLRRSGASVTGLATDAIMTRALHSTSDFPLILGDAVNRELRLAYQTAPSGIRQAARQSTAKDFRAKQKIALGKMSKLEAVAQGGEFKHGTIGESAESYRIGTYGKIFSTSRQVLVNDDLGAFTQVPQLLGAAARDFESDFLVSMLTNNPNMADGVAVFHADHANIQTAVAGAMITAATAARTAMRRQKTPTGDPVSVSPRFLIVPPELEFEAERIVADWVYGEDPASEGKLPPATAHVNPLRALVPVVEPRLTDTNRWFMVSDPAAFEGLEYSYLEGAPGPQIESRAGFEVDGVQTKVRLDFGAGWIDYRGWQRIDMGA